MGELSGKGWRVLGYFLWMLGAGIVLDSDACATGVAILVAGGALFALGAAQSLVRSPEVPS